MKVSIQVSLPKDGRVPTGGRQDMRAAGQAVGQLMRRWSKDYPQFETWQVVRVWHDRVYDLSKPGYGTMSRVRCISPRARVFRPGTWVTVGFYDRQRSRPYIKGQAGHQAPGSFAALHCNPRVDEAQTGAQPAAGRRAGFALDPEWKSDPIGDASSEYPVSLVSGYIDGRPVAWVGCAWGAGGGAFTHGHTKRISCIELKTGLTVWQTDVVGFAADLSNFCAVRLNRYRQELVVVSQFGTGVGPVTLQIVEAATGKVTALSQPIERDISSFQAFTLLGPDHLVGWVPTATGSNLERCKRLRVYARSKEAYSPAYDLVLPTTSTSAPTALPGGGLAGYYWPEADQAVLVVFDRIWSPLPIARSLIVAFRATTGQIEWTWDPYVQLGQDPTRYRIDLQAQRDPDGSLYVFADSRRIGSSERRTYLAKVSRYGETVWTTYTDASGTSGVQLSPHGAGTGIWGPWLLCSLVYNSGIPIDQRPALVNRSSGAMIEGPADWQLYTIEASWAEDWAYCYFDHPTPSTIRYHLVDQQLSSLASVTEALGLGRHQRSTPSAGPVNLFGGWIYGVNWDTSVSRWRLRRWGSATV